MRADRPCQTEREGEKKKESFVAKGALVARRPFFFPPKLFLAVDQRHQIRPSASVRHMRSLVCWDVTVSKNG